MEKGRPKGKYSQGFRLVKMLEMLQTRQNVTISMFCKEFDISRRTAHRDLATLQETYAVEDGGYLESGQKIWRIIGAHHGDLLKLTVLEMASLYMGKNLFNFTRGTELKKSIDSLFSKISHRLASNRASHSARLKTKFYCTPGAPKDYRAVDDQLNEIVTGLLEEQVVDIVYKKPGAKPHKDCIQPWSLVIHNNALYLIAFSENHGEERTYAVERIAEAEWRRGEGFDYPEDFDPENYLSKAFGITIGNPVKVKLQTNREIFHYFEQRRWHSSQRLALLPDGEGEVSLDVPITPEFVSWLLSFGDKIEVLEPMNLRNKIYNIALGQCNLYVSGFEI